MVNWYDDIKDWSKIDWSNIYTSYGTTYIVASDKNVADKNNMCYSHIIDEDYIVYPKVGDVYNFIDATQPVWVGGKPYFTEPNGRSCPIDVKGKSIKILSIDNGDVDNYASIIFQCMGI